MNIVTRLLVAASALAVATPAFSTALVLDSGWYDDTGYNAGEPTEASAYIFTLTGSAYFRVTDAFATGDIWTVTDADANVLGSTSYTTDGAAVPEYYGTQWSDTSYSRLSLLLGAGSYALTLTGDCGAGCPAGFAVRLDTAAVADVPDPASWAMMVGGFGLIGGALRRRTVRVTYA